MEIPIISISSTINLSAVADGERLKHPLILELPDGERSARNGSLAHHFIPGEQRLSGANRITKVTIHHNLKPDNILLDCDWTARIANFGQTSSSSMDARQSLPSSK
jgi:serine/threonine protein kinase